MSKPLDGLALDDPAYPRSDSLRRAAVADQLPFFLRAWWLRDRMQNANVVFGEHNNATVPLWSLHSDPVCDSSNIDNFLM